MIITCEKCSKKFNIRDDLIPKDGREVQCGSCKHIWFFISENETFNLKDETKENTVSDEPIEAKEPIQIKSSNTNKSFIKQKVKKKQTSSKIFKNILVYLISIIAIIILLDTFKYQLDNYVPGLNLILINLYETLKDLFLFFKDLIN